MDLSSIGEFFFARTGGGELNELSESRTGVRKAPRRQLYSEIVERLPNRLSLHILHRDLTPFLRAGWLAIKHFVTRFLVSALLQTRARQIPRPTAPLLRRPPRLCHRNFPAAPPSGWQNCPKLWTPLSRAIPPARFVPQSHDSTECSCSLHPQ